MLLSGQTRYEARVKEHMMMEFSTIDRLDAQPSPRIFNTHLYFSMLPVDAMRQKKNQGDWSWREMPGNGCEEGPLDRCIVL